MSARPWRDRLLDRPRRADRAVEDPAWRDAVLAAVPFGVFAVCDEGLAIQNPNLFVHDREAEAIYFHTARAGRFRETVAASGRASFTAAAMGRLLPAEEALEFSVEYASVTVYGACEALEERREKRRALQLLLDRYAPHLEAGRDYRSITAEETDRTAVYRLRIGRWSGKRNRKPDEFPGAFAFAPPGGWTPLEGSDF